MPDIPETTTDHLNAPPAYPDPAQLPSFLRRQFELRIQGAKRRQVSARVRAAIQRDFAAAMACQARRLDNWPKWEWPTLPVVEALPALRTAISTHQVVVVAGETGSGKTTQLPKLCLELGLGREGIIGHTQPRRLAARSVAARIAEELRGKVGEQVGMKVRFDDQSADHNLICLMTDGMLLQEMRTDPLLLRYQVLIIDEAHERSLNIDFLLGFLKQLLPRRPDLKIIITSATIDHQRFAEFFNADTHGDTQELACTVTVPGRSFPVEMVHRPLAEGEEDLPRQLLAVLEEIEAEERSAGQPRLDVLVFLPGERDIRDAHLALKKAELFATEILPLYARLSPREQARVFLPHKGRRIVLATNVAETSITVPGIGYVIDTGLARISRYSVASKVQRLPVEAISQASANQRAGRAGRVRPGVCFRLYSEQDFLTRPAFTEPEIQRTNLASVILAMADLGLGDIEQFPFLDAPEGRYVRDGYRLLFELSIMDARQQLTPLGKQLARLPLDPRFARMLAAASGKGVLAEALIIVAALAAQDPCERPPDKQQQADQAHQPFQDKRSDFLFFVNLWQWAETQRESLSRSAYDRLLKQTFLSPRRMQEWRETHHQLKQLALAERWTLNTTPADYASLHQALLTGLATQILNRNEEGAWLSCRNRRPTLWPGSALRRSKTPWLVAGELVETNRLYARLLAEIEPGWVLQAVPHLLKHEHSEPHWSKRHEAVMAKEAVSLFGLLLAQDGRIPFDRIDPVQARELMLREGLVEGELRQPLAFVDANLALIQRLAAIEQKFRRRDFLVDEEAQATFYDQAIPSDITNVAALRHWYRKASDGEKKALHMSEDFLLARTAPTEAQQQFPDHLEVDGMRFALAYQFDPAGKRDGVTLTLPQPLLSAFPRWRSDWLVPGLLAEKLEALLRALPKNMRRHVVPIPEQVQALQARLTPTEPLLPALTRELERLTGLRVEQEAWQSDGLPLFLRTNLRVVDEKGRTLAESRDWQALDALAKAPLPASAAAEEAPASNGPWLFGEMPVSQTRQLAGVALIRYPALVDEQKQVALHLFSTAQAAAAAHGWGLVRLLVLARPDIFKRLKSKAASLAGFQKLAAEKSAFARTATDELVLLSLHHRLGLDESAPRSESAWQTLLKVQMGEALAAAEKDLAGFSLLLERYRQLRVRLARDLPLSLAFVHADITTQLDDLFHATAARDWPFDWWQAMPRWLLAIEKRLGNLGREDRAQVAALAECRAKWQLRAEGKPLRELSAPMQHYRRLLEELRVSLFAQQLGTDFPVSFQRLAKQWLAC